MMIRMAVRAPGAGLMDLVGIEQEILAQRGQGAGRARRGQKLGRALEGRRVGQHRKAGGAARLIGLGERRRVEIGADQALGRAGLLDLGDQRDTGRPRAWLSARSGSRAAALWSRGTRLDLGERHLGLGGGDFLALVGFDLAQNVGHVRLACRLETATSRSSAGAPCRCSMAAAASTTPSLSDAALPATISAPPQFSSTMSR